MTYPQNFKEAIISALPNCTIMVIGMMTINLWIYGHLTLEIFLNAFIPIYLIAFLLDFLIVARIASWFVNKYNIQKYTPFIRVALMAGILTFVAPIIESRNIVSLQSYLIALPRNYIFALVLQVFIAIKLGFFVLEKYRKFNIEKE